MYKKRLKGTRWKEKETNKEGQGSREEVDGRGKAYVLGLKPLN